MNKFTSIESKSLVLAVYRLPGSATVRSCNIFYEFIILDSYFTHMGLTVPFNVQKWYFKTIMLKDIQNLRIYI